MHALPLTWEQSRLVIDAQQVYEALRDAEQQQLRSGNPFFRDLWAEKEVIW